MKPRVSCELLSDMEARAIQIRDAILADLAGKNIAGSSFDVAGELSVWSCVGDVIFSSELDGTTWRAQVVTRWTTGALANRILVGSRIHQHRCPHPDGDPSYNCREDLPAQFLEDIKV